MRKSRVLDPEKFGNKHALFYIFRLKEIREFRRNFVKSKYKSELIDYKSSNYNLLKTNLDKL